MLRHTIQTAIAALMIAMAIIVPAASASPIETPAVDAAALSTQAHEHGLVPVGVGNTSSGAGAAAQSHPTSAERPAGGFQWDDAGIGAGAMLVALGLGAGALATIRRSRGRGQPALTG